MHAHVRVFSPVIYSGCYTQECIAS